MIKLGIIGVGGWGRNLLRSFEELPDCRVAMAADLVKKRLSEAQARFPDLGGTSDFRDILNRTDIQGVVVATPGSTHFSIARDCLQAGKHVFVEKPMALTSRECQDLIDLAQRRGLVLMVGHLLLYHAAVKKLKELLEGGTVGRLYYLYFQRLNLGKIRKSENALWTFAPHDISVALHLIGQEPISVAARGESYIQEGVSDIAFAWISFPGNVLAHIHVSWLDPHKIRRVTLVGSKKMMVFDDMEGGEPIKIYDRGVPESLEYDTYGEYLSLRYGDVQIPWLRTGEPLKAECGHFLDCLREGKQPLSDGRNGLKVVRVLEAAQKSMDEGGVTVRLG